MHHLIRKRKTRRSTPRQDVIVVFHSVCEKYATRLTRGKRSARSLPQKSMRWTQRFDQLSTEVCQICGAVRCGHRIVQGVCDRCRDELVQSPGPFVISPDRENPDPWITCAGEYGGILLAFIERIKLAGETGLISVVTEMLLRPVLDEITSSRLSDHVPIGLVPIPASRRGRRRRGFDQSLSLAMALAAGSSGRYRVYPILARRHGIDQKHLDRSKRFDNIATQLVLRRGASLPGDAPIVIIDDVVTTGASMLATRRLVSSISTGPCIGLAAAFRT